MFDAPGGITSRGRLSARAMCDVTSFTSASFLVNANATQQGMFKASRVQSIRLLTLMLSFFEAKSDQSDQTNFK